MQPGLQFCPIRRYVVSMHEPESPVILSLTLHSPRIPPREPTRVATRALQGAVDVEEIAISEGGTPGGAADWVINDIEVDGRSQLAHKNLPGVLFGFRGVLAGRRRTRLSLWGVDTVEREHEFALVVTYVGPNSKGAPFLGVAGGPRPLQRPTVVPIASKAALLPAMKTTIAVCVQNVSFQTQRLVIDNGHAAHGTGDWRVDDLQDGARDWLIEDLRINGRSQIEPPLFGDMLSTTAPNNFLQVEACEIGGVIEIDVAYNGESSSGAPFTARLEGTVVRDDYSVAPPDLHVLVETSGQGPGDVVVATCDWRMPATDNSLL